MARRKRWDRNKYPDNWEEISQQFRASKNFTCEHCGTVRGTFRISKAWNLYQSKVMAAHRYPNDTCNPNPELLCLCERCHFPYDGLFRGIIEEGEHQAVMHEILLDRQGWPEEEECGYSDELLVLDAPLVGVSGELACCSCGGGDESLELGCGNCRRLVHYQEPECGGWVLNFWQSGGVREFWCLECLENGLP